MRRAPRVIQREWQLLPSDYTVTPPERVLPATSCWLWRHNFGGCNGKVPSVTVDGKRYSVRRLITGALPGQRVTSVCALPHCVRPEHLRAYTPGAV